MKYFKLYLLLIILLSINTKAYQCNTVTETTIIHSPDITIPYDLPIGSQIGNQLISNNFSSYYCDNSFNSKLNSQEIGIKAFGEYITIINGHRVYNTNIIGIGYSIGAILDNNCIGSSNWVDGTDTADGNPNNHILCSINHAQFIEQPLNGRVMINFYKIADITGSGRINSLKVASFILRNNHNNWYYPESNIFINPFNITTLTCNITNTIKTINMGVIEKNDFKGIGSWPSSDHTKDIIIPLNCNTSTHVSIQVDGIIEDASKGILKINNSNQCHTNSVACGIGIQLLYNNIPLFLGSEIPINFNEFKNNYNIVLKARYYQIEKFIKPGNANSNASFTITYQ